MRRFAIVLALLLPLALPAAAYAHAHLDHATPPAGSSQATAPSEVVLSFTQDLEPAFCAIEVRNEAGDLVSSGKAQADGKLRTQLRVPLQPLPPGTYKVIWRVLSVDTHRSQGDFTFRVGP
ncbi:MAG: copper resistance protein CopC [Pseudolabrys sp.]